MSSSSIKPNRVPKRQKEIPVDKKDAYNQNTGSGINRKPYAVDESMLYEES